MIADSKRQQLHDVEIERAILGAIVLKPDLLDQAQLTDDDFFDEAHRHVFQALSLMHNASEPIDAASLSSYLTDMGRSLDKVLLAKMLDEHATALTCIAHAKRIRKLNVRRSGLDSLSAAMTTLQDPTIDPKETIAELQRNLDSLSRHVTTDRPRRLADSMASMLSAMQNDDETFGPIPTGYFNIDQRFGMVQRGEVSVIGARPGSGKTTFGIHAALHNAERQRKVLYASIEMSYIEFSKRVACIELGLDHRQMRCGRPDEDVLSEVAKLVGDYDRESFVFGLWAPPTATFSDIAAQARYQHAIEGLDLLIVDHLQIIRGTTGNRDQKRYELLGQVTADFKSLAKELKIAVLLQSQLKRDDTNRPTLSSLRESGNIEQNVDNVWFLHRDGEGIEFIVEKARSGVRGILEGDDALRYTDGGALIDPNAPTPNPEFAEFA